MPRALGRITGAAAALLAATALGAAGQPGGATFERSAASSESSFASDAEPGERGASDGPDGVPGGPGRPGGPKGFGGPGKKPGYEIAWYPSASASGPGSKLAMVRNRLGVETSVWSRDGNAIMASLDFDESHFSGAALLPQTLRAFPTDLWKIEAGLKHMHRFSSGSSSMLMLDIGTAGDRPFHSSRDLNYTVGGFYRKPVKNGRDSWMLGAIYSPLGPLDFPIPLVAYDWNPSARFHASIGIPFSMAWRPTDRLDLDLSLNPGGIDALGTYQWSHRLRTYGGYQNVSDQYFLSGRVAKKDEFFAIEQRLIVGLRRDLWNGVSLDLNGGYAFDRHFGEGHNEGNLHDRVNLDSSAFLGARLIWAF